MAGYFLSTAENYVLIVSGISMILLVFRKNNYLVVIALTLNVVAFALYTGEIKNKIENQKHYIDT